jgi:hypothetical protein
MRGSDDVILKDMNPALDSLKLAGDAGMAAALFYYHLFLDERMIDLREEYYRDCRPP